jgi:hypothetical protein
MEMHVCDWNKEQLDVLKEYNFNIVIVCIQTFDRVALKKYKRRVPKDIDVVCEHIQYAHSLGLKTNSDLLYLDTGNTTEDIDRLMVDMQLLADNNISEITIQTLFDEVNIQFGNNSPILHHTIQQGKFDNIVTAATELFLNKNPKYAMYNTFVPVGEGIDIPITYKTKNEKGPARCVALRMIRRDETPAEIFHWIPQLEEMEKWPNNVSNYWTNTLGIGSYNNYKDTFSTIEDRIEYKEVGNLNFPEFYITYNKLDYKIKELIAMFYEELEFHLDEEPPDGIKFNFSTVVNTSNPMNLNKQVKRELIVQMVFPERDDNELVFDYRKKLDTIWPNISKYLEQDNFKKRSQEK